ncbi:LuxR C-terminal-related transcriptional regulator [Nonomuraea sp. B10E8]|uniref:helix-turn-helix transcriptional regulator n=2 Tax=unclassified Nonomuraea TaxID=2593643 RepID=UPI00325D68B9
MTRSSWMGPLRENRHVLHGRSAEQAAIDDLLSGARSGCSGVLVVRGEAGIGKSALLEYAVDQAADMRVLRSVGVEAEAALAFAGLHMLLGGFVDRLGVLPGPQAAVLRGAFGLAVAPAGDRFLAGLATLSLLSEVAEERPMLVAVDDTHWLDRASVDALLFAARRLEAEPIAVVLTARDGHRFTTPGLPELRLSALDRTAGAAVLAEHARDLAPHVRDRVLAEAQGNPLALRELPAAMTPEQRAGEAPAVSFATGTQSVASRVEESFGDRIQVLPERTRQLLLIAAADEGGDLGLVLRAGERLGAGVADLEAAERDRLVRVNAGRLVFTHPLIRAAAYRVATFSQQLAVHRTLADLLGEDLARRAWHLAAATTEPDETVAAELERTAEAARSRGGYAEVAAAYQRAAQLTPDPGRRAMRLVAAARTAGFAGQGALATDLAEQAGPHVSDPRARAQLAWLRVFIAHEQERPPPVVELAEAAMELGKQSPHDSVFMLLEAMAAAWTTDRDREVRDVINCSSPVADGHFGRVTEAVSGMGAEEPQNPVRILLHEIGDSSDRPIWQRQSTLYWTLWAGDLENAVAGLTQLLDHCRSTGMIGLLPRVCLHLGRGHLFLGRHRDARATSEEGLKIAEDTDRPHFAAHLSGLLACVAAIEGDEAGCREAIGDVLAGEPTERGIESRYAMDLLDLGLGRYEAVVHRMAETLHDPAICLTNTLVNQVEAAVHAGRRDLAKNAAARFGTWAEVAGRPCAEAMELRCRALLADGAEAGRLYARAVQLHREDRAQPFERARTELLYGTWLRRDRRRNDAREPLHSALEIFERLRAKPWAERAGAELRAAGEARQAQAAAPDLLDRLTPQELNVVRLAAKGLSNRDIGARLFVSPRTVGYHLYNAYPKLGVASRTELIRMLLPRD